MILEQFSFFRKQVMKYISSVIYVLLPLDILLKSSSNQKIGNIVSYVMVLMFSQPAGHGKQWHETERAMGRSQITNKRWKMIVTY